MQNIKTFLFFSLILLGFLFSIVSVLAEIDTSGDIESIIGSNIEKVDLSELPWIVKFLVGKPEFNVIVQENSGSESLYGLKVTKDRKIEFSIQSYEKPDYFVYIDEASVREIGNAENSGAKINEFYGNGKIVIVPQKIKGKFLFKIASWFF